MPLPLRYPRDMGGHGAAPPDAQWPGGAKIAVQIVLNYEEGGENNILHGDPASEAFLSEIVGATPWPGQRHWNMESLYEYGARAGFWRLHRLLRDLPITVFGVATALARAPEQVAAMQAAGWEIASHGLKWIDYGDARPEAEAAEMQAALKLHAEVVGDPPRGWYTGRCSLNTVALAADTGQFAYVADSYADDLPYWVEVGERDQLIVPYTLDANDMRFATPQGFNAPAQFFDHLRATFDTLYREGVEGVPRMMSVGLHCRLAGRPGRAEALRRFLDHVRVHDDVWWATRLQIAHHWVAVHPHRRRERPSAMGLRRFVEVFGKAFEHSPWVAERAHALELGPHHDTAAGLLNAMCRAFRAAPEADRLAVLQAHPDLAGKLATAWRLTTESAGEQASAGLDALSDDDRRAFAAMNAAYADRFGFPFIIAVRDHDRDSIRAAFEARLKNDRAAEIAEACRQVERIAAHRLNALLP